MFQCKVVCIPLGPNNLKSPLNFSQREKSLFFFLLCTLLIFCALDGNMTQIQPSYLSRQCHLTSVLAPDWPREAILVIGRVSYAHENSIKLCRFRISARKCASKIMTRKAGIIYYASFPGRNFETASNYAVLKVRSNSIG